VSKPEEVPRCVERFDSRPIMGDNEATLLRLWRGEARRGEPGRTVRQTSSASSGSYPQSGTGASTKPNPGKSSLTFGDTLAIPAPALDGGPSHSDRCGARRGGFPGKAFLPRGRCLQARPSQEVASEGCKAHNGRDPRRKKAPRRSRPSTRACWPCRSRAGFWSATMSGLSPSTPA
jgi:hypothetical protein